MQAPHLGLFMYLKNDKIFDGFVPKPKLGREACPILG
jgi:hypothetical protein